MEGYQVQQKAFVSHPHQIMVITINTEHPKGLEGTIGLQRPLDEGFATASIEAIGQSLIMRGEVTQQKGAFRSNPAPIKSGVAFETHLEAHTNLGSIIPSANTLKVKGVK